MVKKDWKEIVKESRARRDMTIPEKWRVDFSNEKSASIMHFATEGHPLVSERQKEITTLSAGALLQAIKDKKYTCVEVCEAFAVRACIAHQLTNCVSEFFIEEGLETARKLDEYYERTGQLWGPFHGLPVSVKDHFHLAGHLLNTGFTAWADFRNKPEDEDGIFKELRKAGCVFFMKTHMPTSGMVLETTSNLWGNVYNPYNRKVTSGGSSGGETIMISMYGTPMAIGTDGAGSIRCPAGFCGNYSLKPTSGRFDYTGQSNYAPNQVIVPGVPGPICRSLSDVKLMSKFLIDVEPWTNDPNAVAIPWRESVLPEKLTIGLLKWDGVAMPHPPIQRALREVRQKLEAAGHEVYEFEMPFDCEEAMKVTMNIYFQSGFAEGKKLLAETGEPLMPALEQLFRFYNIDRELTGSESFKLAAQRNKYRKQFLTAWKDTATKTKSGRPIDALMCPISPGAAFAHDLFPWWGYTSLFNMLDYPGITLPIKGCFSDKTKDPKDTNYTPVGPWDKYTYDQYDPDLFHGTPISLQFVGKRFFEEDLLQISQVLDKVVNNVDN
ncbi:hypothetical protein TRICI_006815 [Trichomonascus ciferrii]|uniref:Amidase domain-containing protein n=1 Tax=Trichomonascus ciferrii TaxID=44093 RepID=A0A642UCW2_9ASCO|nr:hypothetical protein TRICI_006815 [Trichomonascus ciferrii]